MHAHKKLSYLVTSIVLARSAITYFFKIIIYLGKKLYLLFIYLLYPKYNNKIENIIYIIIAV